MKNENFSTEHEPCLQGGGFETDPSEKRAKAIERDTDEMDSIRDSVENEPALTLDAKSKHLGKWIAEKKAQCSTMGNLSYTAVAALIGGPFAVLGAFMAGQHGIFGVVYIILFGPVIEELLKQSGMVFLLEKRPWRIFTLWQFVFCAAVSALIFASIENLLYIHLYSADMNIADTEYFAKFRWTVCTALHVCCSVIASMGLIKVWKKQLTDGRPADLSVAYPYFLIAMIIHGCYNFVAVITGPQWQMR